MKQILHVLARFALLEFIAFLCMFVFLSTMQRSQLPERTGIVPVITGIPQAQITGSIPTKQPRNLFAELAFHNRRDDCWILYQGHIYNITSFFGSHPGGDSIMLTYCGADAAAGFDTKESNPPNPHSGSAKSLLQQFLIQ